MSKTIIFKPEFEKKLKKLKIKTKFIKNLRNPKWTILPNLNIMEMNYKRMKYKERFENSKNWSEFISHAFNWINSPEGFDYWDKISNL